MEEKARVCTRCNELKSIEDFPLNHSTVKGKKYSYPRHICKVCYNGAREDRRTRIGNSQNRITNQAANKRKARIKSYGLSIDQHNQMVIEQHNCCAICKSPANGESLHIDHNHTNGQVRGLLCRTCNSGLGMFKDNPEILLSAIAYLTKDKFND